MISDVLCPGQSLLVNGVVYDQSDPSGTEVITNRGDVIPLFKSTLPITPMLFLN
jgi:hypothetical protein